MDTELEKMVNLSPTVKLPIIGPKINELSDNGFTSIQEGTTTKKRYKKIKSVNTKSFWKISDASIQEVNLNSVLSETKYVYMLYYEKTK